MKPESLNHYGYNLHLADGQKWQIVSTEEVRLWMEGLASVMRLETCRVNESPKLIFIQKKITSFMSIICTWNQSNITQKKGGNDL